MNQRNMTMTVSGRAKLIILNKDRRRPTKVVMDRSQNQQQEVGADYFSMTVQLRTEADENVNAEGEKLYRNDALSLVVGIPLVAAAGLALAP